MFKSEVTNKVLDIILFLGFMLIVLSKNNVDTQTKTLTIFMVAARILYDLYKIIKIKRLKAD